MKERLIGLFEERFGRRPDAILDMAADGSTRQYFRLVGPDDRTAVGAIGPDRDVNRAFLGEHAGQFLSGQSVTCRGRRSMS
jgi:N-acetylmuramate 1-kinase